MTLQDLIGLAQPDAASVDVAYAAAAEGRALTGTDKQVEWAETIRRKALVEIARAARPHAGMAPQWGQHAPAFDRLLAITDASWWIDNRAAGTMMLRAAQTVGA